MRFIKWLLGLLLLVVVLIGATIVILPLVIDPNNYRDQISAQVKAKTGRTLAIEDPMKLSVFPWVGLELGRVKFGNAEGFGETPFASIKALQLRVKVRPLLSKRIEIDTVVVDGLDLNLTRKATGQSNWDGLSGSSDNAVSEQSASTTDSSDKSDFSVDIQGIDLRNANIVWDDMKTGERYALSNVSLKTGQLVFGRTVPVTLGLSIASQKPVLNMDVEVSAEVKVDESGKQISFADLELLLGANGEGLPAAGLKLKIGSDLAIDLLAGTVDIRNLLVEGPSIAIDGNIKGSGINSTPIFTGNVNMQETNLRDLLVLTGVVIETTDPDVLSRVSGNIGLSASSDSVKLDPLQINLDDSKLQGSMHILSFDGPAIKANLNLDEIDLDRYLPPTAGSEVSEQQSTSGQAAVSASMTQSDPFAALRTLNMNAAFTVGKLKLMNVRMQNASVKIVSQNGVVQIDPVSGDLYQGKLKAAYELDVRQAKPTMRVRENLTGIAVGPLLTDALAFDKLSGTGEIHTDLRMVGLSEQDIRNSLNGNFRFSFRNGAYSGINLAQTIRDAGGLLGGKTVALDGNGSTDFSELSGSGQITNGIIVNKDLKAQSPLLRIAGAGKINLPEDSLDYTLSAILVGSLKGQGGLAAKELQGVEIPVRLTGNLLDPSISIDPVALMSSKTTKKIDAEKGRLKKRLKGKIKDEKLQKQLDGVFKGIF